MLDGSALSGRRLLAVGLLVALGAVLVPAGVQAAPNMLTILKDADSDDQAQVDAGKLRVGDGDGPLTVDGTVNVSEPVTVDGAVTALDGGAQQPKQIAFSFSIPEGFPSNIGSFQVPAGKRMVIEYVSISARAITGQKLLRARVRTVVGGTEVFHELFPAFVGSDAADIWTAAQEMRIYADPDTNVWVQPIRDVVSGSMTIEATVSGYLVNI